VPYTRKTTASNRKSTARTVVKRATAAAGVSAAKSTTPKSTVPKTAVPKTARTKTAHARPTPPPSVRAKAVREKTAPARRAPPPQSLKSVVIEALEDMKALEIKVLDVRGLTDIADMMIIASGTSDRHVRSVAQRVVEKTKGAGYRPHGIEGQQDSDWVLIDLHDMIVHVMLPRVREFYGLEKLWDMTATKRAAARA